MKYLSKIANGKTWIALALLYTVFVISVMPSLSRSAESAGGPLDLLFSYPPELVFQKSDALGESGRRSLVWNSMVFDTIYPILYTALFVVSLKILIDRISMRRLWQIMVMLPPLFAFGFDLSENASIIAVIRAYPAEPILVAKSASLFTSLKWISVAVTFVLLTILSFVWLIQRWSARGSDQPDNPS